MDFPTFCGFSPYFTDFPRGFSHRLDFPIDFPMDFPTYQPPNLQGGFPLTPGGRDWRSLGTLGSGGTHSGGDAARASELTSTSKAWGLLFKIYFQYVYILYLHIYIWLSRIIYIYTHYIYMYIYIYTLTIYECRLKLFIRDIYFDILRLTAVSICASRCPFIPGVWCQAIDARDWCGWQWDGKLYRAPVSAWHEGQVIILSGLTWW